MKKISLLTLLLCSLFLMGCGNKATTPNTNPVVNDTNQPTNSNPENEINNNANDDIVAGEDNTAASGSTAPSVGKKPGTGYTTYNETIVKDALASGKKVALFFHAARCPNCVALNGNIETNFATIPADTMIYKVDYDTSDDLKEKYGVTSQHTLVYIDKDMEEVNKVVGPTNLDEVIAGFNK